MPIVRIEFLPSRSAEKKAEIAREITRVMAEVGGAKPESTQVVFTEIAASDWMIGGQMLSDKGKA